MIGFTSIPRPGTSRGLAFARGRIIPRLSNSRPLGDNRSHGSRGLRRGRHHDRQVKRQPPLRAALGSRARRAWHCRGRPRPGPRAPATRAAAGARQFRHPQRPRHDDGTRHRRHRRRRRARQGRLDRRDRPIPGGAGLEHDQGRGHDRAAGAGRDPLAHVEHAAAQHVGREGRVRLFPHHRRARAEIRAKRHVPGHPARRGRGAQFRHHLRPQLVPQHPQSRLCGSRPAGAAGIGPARALLLRADAGASQYPDHRSRGSRATEPELGELFERRPHHARHGLARTGRQQPGDRGSSGNLYQGDRDGAAARPADHRACQRLAARRRPGRSPRQGEPARQGHADRPRHRAHRRRRSRRSRRPALR